MMDGRIGAIKSALQLAGAVGERTAVMSYAAKFAVCILVFQEFHVAHHLCLR